MIIRTRGLPVALIALFTLLVNGSLAPFAGGSTAAAQTGSGAQHGAARAQAGQVRPHVATSSSSVIIVTTNADDGRPGSLRDAISHAQSGDVITFLSGLGTITLNGSPLALDHYDANLTIAGPLGGSQTISGGGASRVFVIGTYAHVTFRNLTITGGASGTGADGGGIANAGTLTIVDSTITGNATGAGADGSTGNGGANGGAGGGIANSGTLTLLGSTVSDNRTGTGGRGGDGNQACVFGFCHGNPPGLGGSGGGGGGIVNSGTMTVNDSTITGNTTGGGGHGGCQNGACSGGGVGGSGGGISSGGTLTVASSTIARNRTGAKSNGCCPFDGQGAGIGLTSGSLALTDTIVALNDAPTAPNDVACDAGFPISSGGYNLIKDLVAPDNRFTCAFTGSHSSDITGQDPQLGSLQNNGGPTDTEMPAGGSPAVAAIPASACDVSVDQRGAPRPGATGRCDIGAVESTSAAPPRIVYPTIKELGSKSTLYHVPCGGDPVDCASGEFTHSVTDLSIPGRGLALNVVRTYKTLNAAQDGRLGHGWTDSYDMGLTTDASGTITVTEESGTAVTFALSGTTYRPPSRVLASLVANGDGTLTFSRTDQTHYTFSAPTTGAAGHLLSETDRNGYTTTLGYSGGQLTTITDPAGRSFTLSYTGARISRIVDPIGRTVAFTYNAAGDLTDATDVRGDVTHYTYDPGTHLLLSMTGPRGGVVRNTYDSASRVVAQTDALGRTTGFTYTMDATGAQTTTLTDPNGNVTVERFQGNLLLSRTKGYGTPQAATWTYTYDPATLGIASETDPNGHTTTNTYDARGNLLGRTDALSRTTTYAYNALNDTTAITDPLGVTLAITYDASGNVLASARPLTQTGQVALTTYAYDPAHPGDMVASTDPDGHKTTYGYDAFGDRTSITDPLSHTTTYQYDPIGRKTSMVRPNGNLAGANPISYTTTMTYDAAGNTTAITSSLGYTTTYGYDADNNRITTTDSLGRQTINGYDLGDERISVQQPDGGIARASYDGDGNVITATDPLGHATTYGYDPLNRRVGSTDALGRPGATGYDLAGNVITMTDALGHATIYGYDAADERTSVTEADGGTSFTGYDADGRVISTTDALRRTTLTGYDSLNRRISVIDPLGRTTLITDDLVGNVITTTDPLGRSTIDGYDAANRRTLVSRPDGSTIHTGYDADNNVITTTDPLGHSMVDGYDMLDRLVSSTDPLSHTTTDGYDAVGNRVSSTDPLSHTTTYGYDMLDRVITATDPLSHTTLDSYDLAGNHTSHTDALGHVTLYGYDSANERTSVTQADGSIMGTGYDLAGRVISSTDALGRATLYGYDVMNRRTSMADPLGRTTAYTYDLVGDRIALTDPMGRTTRYGYDVDDEPITITYASSSTPDVTMTYYASGQRASMADGTGTTTYQYDALDRPITVTNGAGQRVGYGYDLAGNLTTLSYPDASVITRTYDAANRFVAVTDAQGHTTRFGYDAADRAITQTYPTTSPITASMAYNAADQLTHIQDSSPRRTLLDFGYGRDALGQVRAVSDTIDGPIHTYGYSALNQLVADRQGTSAVTTTTSWAPDAASQITGTINGLHGYTGTATYDRAGEVTGRRLTGAISTTYTYPYNPNGDRTGTLDSSGATGASYSYDQADRLIAAAVTDTTGLRQATYAYNGDGVRMSKVVSGTAEGFAWDTSGGLPLLVQDSAARYINGPDGLPVEMISGTTTLYFLRDQLGSTRGVLSSAGALIASYAYDAYGTLKLRQGIIKSVRAPLYTPFLYAGQYTDAETGFQYLQARYYDPATQQFLTMDPQVAQTKQPYAYTGSNPVNGTDPTGLCGFLQTISPVDPYECVGSLTAAALQVGIDHPNQAHQVAQWAETTNADTERWLLTTRTGRLVNSLVVEPACILADPNASDAEKLLAAGQLALFIPGAGDVVGGAASFILRPLLRGAGKLAGRLGDAALEKGGRSLYGGVETGIYNPEGVLLGQKTASTCTATSCLMLARDAGVSPLLGQDRVAQLLQTTTNGASIERVPGALKQIANETGISSLKGYKYREGLSIEDLAASVNSHGPAIVSVKIPLPGGGEGLHAIVVDGITKDGQVLIRDPSPGGAFGGEAYSVSQAGFLKDWQGRAVVAP